MNRNYSKAAQGLALAALLASAPAWAQDPIAGRIDKLEQEIAELKKLLSAQQQQQEQQQDAS